MALMAYLGFTVLPCPHQGWRGHTQFLFAHLACLLITLGGVGSTGSQQGGGGGEWNHCRPVFFITVNIFASSDPSK